jgi:hypothetical protein
MFTHGFSSNLQKKLSKYIHPRILFEFTKKKKKHLNIEFTKKVYIKNIIYLYIKNLTFKLIIKIISIICL